MTPSSTVSAMPADAPAHRQRPIPLRPHLGQPAGLVDGGHEEHVGARHEPVLHPVAEVRLDADLLREGAPQLEQRVRVALLAAAEEHELGIDVEQVIAREDDVEPLLLGQATREGEERGVPALRQAERPLQRRLAAFLGLEVLADCRSP